MIKQTVARFDLSLRFGLLSTAWLLSSPAVGQSYSYTDFVVPGAADTILAGINNSGSVVGVYGNSINVVQPMEVGWNAFLHNGSSVTTLVPPGSLAAEASAINNNGTVVGTYLIEVAGVQSTRGFVYDGSTYQTILVPFANALDTTIASIDDNGVIVGSYAEDFLFGLSLTTLGFRGTPDGIGGYTYESIDLDVSNEFDITFMNGRNTSGQEVATHSDGVSVVDGVLLPEAITVGYPGVGVTSLTGINNNGLVSGRATFANPDESLFEIGFVVDSAEILTLPPGQVNFLDVQLPGSGCTFSTGPLGVDPDCHKSIQGLNDQSTIVGFYDDGDTVFKGFIGTLDSTQPGDFDGDGDVDGDDFLEWQQGLGTIYDADDLTDWETHYGTGVVLGISDATSVPESTSFALFLTSLVCVAIRRRT